jgi:hypothetical protein
MAFIKLQTDAFINPKVRRLSDGAFRMWVYLLGQAWVESPGKPAGTITVRGIVGDNDTDAQERVSETFGQACGADDGNVYMDTGGQHKRMLNELENVGLVHITASKVGTSVGTSEACPTCFWDMSLSMHDWAHHNPRKPPSHQPEGEAERKRKYRALQKNNGESSPKSSPKRPNGAVPSVPALDKDQDLDKYQDLRQTAKDSDRLAGESISLRKFREDLSDALGLSGLIAIAKPEEAQAVAAFFEDQIVRAQPEWLLRDCLAAATKAKTTPGSLRWFKPWIEKLYTPPKQEVAP